MNRKICLTPLLLCFGFLGLIGCEPSDPRQKMREEMYERLRESERRYASCKPIPLSIDKMGWEAFLKQWNQEVLFWVKKTVLEYGADPNNAYSDEQWQAHLNKQGIPLEPFMQLKEGGIPYPPKNEEEERRVTAMLKLHREFIGLEMKAYYKRFNQQFGKDTEHFFSSDEEVLYRDSILFPPVKADEIVVKEKELGIQFPVTYKNFLKVSNGLVTDSVRIASVNGVKPFFSTDGYSSVFWEVFLAESLPDSTPLKNFKAGDKLPEDVQKALGEEAEVYEFERQSLLFSDDYDDYDDFYLLFNPHKQDDSGDWMGWRDSGDGDGGMEIDINKARSFKGQMELMYQEDVARKCANYKWLGISRE